MKILLSCFVNILLSLSIVFSVNAAEKTIPETKKEILLSFAPLVKKASPAVVNIYTKKKVTVKRTFSPFFNDPIFKHFFNDNFAGGQTTERVESSLGSGVVVSSDGLIVTSHHVIEGSTDITVVLSDRREFEAKILLNDKRTDLALLKIDTKKEKLAYLELMDSDNLDVGDIVIAIGNPFGVGQTVTSGIVSALARTTIGVSDYQFFIQTDAAINPGNSGGALVNMEGKLAGLNTAIFTKSGGSNGIGFAIPSNMVATVIRSKDGHIVRPWLGISTQTVTQDIAGSLGLDKPTGAILSNIHPKSPAAKAGLKVGDVILKVDKHEIPDNHSLQFRIATYQIGNFAKFTIIRDTKYKEINVEMIPPPEYPKRDLRIIEGRNPLSGATIANLSPALAEELGLNVITEGVIITTLTQGIAAQLGLNQQDIIKKINDIEATSSKQVEDLVSKESSGWKVLIQRGNQMLNVMWNVR